MKKDKELIRESKGKTCEFEYQGRRCESTEIVGIARGRFLCKIHYKTVSGDNIRRINKGLDMPEDLIFTKKLSSADTWSKAGYSTKLTGGNNGS